MGQGLLIVVPNFSLTPGKWMGSNFLLSVLSALPFRERGVEVHVVSRGDKDTYCEQGHITVHKIASSSLAVEPFDRYGLWWSGQLRVSPVREVWGRLRDSAKVAGLVRRLLPRVRTALWWTEPHAPLGSAVRAYGSLRKVKNVFTLANYQRSYPLHDTLLRAGLAGFDHIVSPCYALQEHLASVGVPRRKLLTIPLGVDLEHFRPASPEEKARLRRSYGVEEGARVVAWFGPIIPPSHLEDLRFLLAAVPAIRRKAPDAVFVFAFKYGIPPNLIPCQPWLKTLDHYSDMRDVFHLADVAALPFTASDPWITAPLSMVEALACGLPVVTLKHPGLTEVVTDGESGVLIERLAEFSQAVGDLCADEGRRAYLAGAARRRAEQDFDVRIAAQRYAQLLLGE